MAFNKMLLITYSNQYHLRSRYGVSVYADSDPQLNTVQRAKATIYSKRATDDVLSRLHILVGCSSGGVVSTLASDQCGLGSIPGWGSDPGAVSEKGLSSPVRATLRP